jgi:coproporphyrinogen III oxidase
MTFIAAKSQTAADALALVQKLQTHFCDKLCALSSEVRFKPVSWLRDGGQHGGGTRLAFSENVVFNRASINVSQVHYDDEPSRTLGSAAALSSIIHPAHPRLPSIHLHISWTAMKTGPGYWRMMADLNPAIPDDGDRLQFEEALHRCTGNLYQPGKAQGDSYFYIPALKRHRGVSHFYLEQFRTSDAAADSALALNFGQSMVNCYGDILAAKLPRSAAPSAEDQAAQLAYHTLYLFQVLTLDRGTTAGLLVHDQNDLGVLASLPARIDRKLLSSWERLLEKPQDELLRGIVGVIPEDGTVEDQQKLLLCKVLRHFYKTYPQCLP